MNIECFLVSRWLEPFFDGELGRCRSRLVRKHVARCPVCRHRLNEMEDLRVALTRVAARAPVPTDFKQLWARLSSGLPHPHHGSARSRWFRLLQRILIPQQPVWVPAALAIVLVAAVGVIWQIRAPMHEKSNTVIIDYIESQHSSVMIVQPENPGDMTVIWIFEEMNKGTSA